MKTTDRARLLLGVALAALAFAAPLRAQGQFPDRPIRLIVPFAPGGVTDTSARVVAEKLGQLLGQQVVVDNKPGASGNIGTQMVAKAEPDGYTLLMGFDGTLVINPHLSKAPFDPVKDFAPIGKIGDAALVIVVNPKVPARNFRGAGGGGQGHARRPVVWQRRQRQHAAPGRRDAQSSAPVSR